MLQGSLVRALRVACEDVVCMCAQHVHAFVCVYVCACGLERSCPKPKHR